MTATAENVADKLIKRLLLVRQNALGNVSVKYKNVVGHQVVTASKEASQMKTESIVCSPIIYINTNFLLFQTFLNSR